MADEKEKKPEEKQQVAGTVLYAGATDYMAIGRTKDVREDYPNLSLPHKLKALEGIKVAFVATGSTASHCLVCDVNGVAYTWGRNDKGQLGLGDNHNRTAPTVVEALKDVKIVGGACGRHHTVFITATGESYACGLNASGQCGTGSVKKVKGVEDIQNTPQLCLISKCSTVACGSEFTMWLCDGKLVSAGNPQYGQLGHGTDNQYNASDSSIKMVFDPQPTPRIIATLADKTVTRIACGANHSVCVCEDGSVYTWGFGGYGRLGHRVQQDEMKPRLVEALSGRIAVPADAVIGAGSTSSFCTIVGGQLFAWGKLKTSGDNQMYPTPYYELAGWDIRGMCCGNTTFACTASSGGTERSVITWGQAGYQELAYGPTGKKSSANPEKCNALDGVNCYQVAMGAGQCLFLCDSEDGRVLEAPVWEPKEIVDQASVAAQLAAGAKRKAPAAAKGGKKKK